MQLQINSEYRIRTDENCIMLEKSRIAKDGKNQGNEIWEVVGYYPDIEWAYKGMIRHGILKSDLQGVDEVLLAVKTLAVEIRESLSESNIKQLVQKWDKLLRDMALENELLKKQLNRKGVAE